MKIFSYVTSLLDFFKKDNVLEDLRITQAELKNTVEPIYGEAEKYFAARKFESEEIQSLERIFDRTASRDLKSSRNMVVDLHKALKNVQKNADEIESLLSKDLEEDVIKDGLTAKKAILVRAAEQLSFVSTYMPDLLNYIYIKEAQAVLSKGSAGNMVADLSPAQIKRIEERFVGFISVMNILCMNTNKFRKEVAGIPEVIVSANNADVVHGAFREDKIDPFSSGLVQNFSGSPIYHIRLMFAEWQANRYKAMKEKKKLLELRLLYLQSIQEGNQDAKTQSELEYIQNRITDIEYKMTKMEESVA